MISLTIGTALALLLQAGAWTDFDAADARLQGAYDTLRAERSAPERLALRDAERRWIVQRNAACGAEARNACAVRLTQRRTVELTAEIARSHAFQSLPDRDLLALERRIDEICRGSGQDADGPACSRRDAIVTDLERRGWCWGPDTATEVDSRWMRAGAQCHNP